MLINGLGLDLDVEMVAESNDKEEEALGNSNSSKSCAVTDMKVDLPYSENASEDDAISDDYSMSSEADEEDQLAYNEEEDIAETPKDVIDRLRDLCGPDIEEKLYRISTSFSHVIGGLVSDAKLKIEHLMIMDDNRDNIRAFQLKLSYNMPCHIFDCMRKTFRHKLNLQSEWIVLHQLSVLSGVDQINFDCCVNSCVAYTTKYEHFTRCRFCNEPRYGKGARAQRTFSYIPIMPQLQAFFQKAEMDTQLAHRDQFEHINGIFHDIFDGHWYHKLWRTHVVIDGVQQPHKFFSGKNDITLLLSTDGFLLFNR